MALAEGMERGGVASCGKHFPGHGDTLQDSHLTLPVLEHGLARLEAVGPSILPGLCPGRPRLGDDRPRPLPGPRRGRRRDDEPRLHHRAAAERIGFDGVVVSDDLEMKAISDPTAAAVDAVRAGVDLLLVCHHAAVQHQVLDALVAAARKGIVTEERLREAHARIDALVGRFVRPRRIESVSSDRRSTAG